MGFVSLFSYLCMKYFDHIHLPSLSEMEFLLCEVLAGSSGP
jgi:hypothetical protein